MKLIRLASLFLLTFTSLFTFSNTSATAQPVSGDIKAIVVYFSRPGENYATGKVLEGNTKIVAKMVQEALSSDLMEIVPVEAYPVSYEDTVKRYKEERKANARPAIKTDRNMNSYNLIFLGYPIWGGKLPLPVVTWLESTDLSGKTIVPFSTHGGSGLASTPKELRNFAKGAEIRKGFSIFGTDAQNLRVDTRRTVEEWLKANGYLKK